VSACTFSDLPGLAARLASVPGTRPVGLRAVEIGPQALAHLPALIRQVLPDTAGGTAAVLRDDVPKFPRGDGRSGRGAEAGETVTRLLAADHWPRDVIVPGSDGHVYADAETIGAATGRVRGAALLVTVGSGTIADIGKAVSARLGGLPHVIVQTAASVNGFADDQSVLLLSGVKRTTQTRWPDVLVADTDLLAGAPIPLTRSGLGDLMAMFTAPADWRLAQLLGMADSYQEPLVSLVRGHSDALLQAAPGISATDPDAIGLLATLLALSGIAMGAAGTTAPSSGAEHTVSHLLDMAAAARGGPPALHGAQVGMCAVLTSLLWQRVIRLLASPRVTPHFPSEAEMEPRVRGAFDPYDPAGAMAGECWQHYRRKLARWRANRSQLLDLDWAGVARQVAGLLTEPAQIAAGLERAGAPARPCELDPPIGQATMVWAMANCHLMRDRFTVADLAFFLGAWGPDEAGEVLGEAGRLEAAA
jgi:glycerol-1-phosphate dehydrogenase [NAD(P)+]